jgi:hypothetical protein
MGLLRPVIKEIDPYWLLAEIGWGKFYVIDRHVAPHKVVWGPSSRHAAETFGKCQQRMWVAMIGAEWVASA